MNESLSGEVDQIKHLFKGIWTLEYIDTDLEVRAVVEKAIANPNRFVIKPQMEGGGNNFYGDKVKNMLLSAYQDQN